MATEVFIDANVLIDYLTGREPFATDARDIIKLSEEAHVKIFTTVSIILICLYFGRKTVGMQKTKIVLQRMLPLLHILETSKDDINRALISSANDYEDAIQYFTALSDKKIKFFITRNPKDFKNIQNPQLSVLTPRVFLDLHGIASV
jgi:predicted nucleic acid-binding protein